MLGFTNAPDQSLTELAERVKAQFYGNAAFPNPPVTLVDFTAALTAFINALAAQAVGGKEATADKNNKRDDLVALLRKNAGHVQEHHNDDLATLLSSGFEAVSGHHPSTPLSKPTQVRVDNGGTGQLIVKIKAIANAKCYEVRYAVVGTGGTLGPWQPAGMFTNSRAMIVSQLTPGGTYSLQVRAVGGSTGYSDWSDPVSHMCL